MIVINLFIDPEDSNSQSAKAMIEGLRNELPIQLAVIDIRSESSLFLAYQGKTPVVKVGPYTLNFPFTEQDLKVAVGAAIDRDEHLDKMGDKKYKQKLRRGHKLSSADRISYWLTRNYMILINVFLFIYVGLPFLPPYLIRSGINAPARVIYAIYSPLCHQLPYRSWFLFGEQPYYPRELADIPEVASYESFIGDDPYVLNESRHYIGNEAIGLGEGEVGIKVALCQRDTAIYLGLFLFGLLFVLTGRKIKPISWFLWILFGLIPIGLDGASQLPGLVAALPDWLWMRESTPILRVITGSLFGITTAWYLFPMIEENMVHTRVMLAGKIAAVGQMIKDT